MKFSQAELTKLAFGAVGGYIASSLLFPHRGFAKITADNPPGSPGGPKANIDTGQDLTPQQIKHPGARPKGIPPQGAFQPFTPNYITGVTPSGGPVNAGICRIFPLPGCDTVVDPKTGKSVSVDCTLPGTNFTVPFPCWILIAGALILILLVK